MRTAGAILLAAALATGCATAFDQAVRRAEAAGEAGDRIGAALAWREACALRSDAHEACATADRAARVAIDEALVRARCEVDDPAACVERLRPARLVSPEDPALLEAIDAAADRHAARCGHVDRLDEIVPVLSCLERIERQVDRRGYSALITEEARHAAALVMALPSHSPGAALVKASTAACFGDDGATSTLVHLRAAFDAAAQVPVWPRTRVTGARIDAADLCEGLPVGARCDPDAAFAVDVGASVGPTLHRVETETRSVQYAAGEYSVPNPAHAEADARRREALRAVQELEPRVASGRARCDAARRDATASNPDAPVRRHADRVCDEFRALENLLSDRRFALGKAESELSHTPRSQTEIAYAEHLYTVERHRWSVDYTASVAGRAWSETLRHEDSTHPAFAPAGVAGDPLEAPGRGAFTALVSARLGDAFGSTVRQQLLLLAAERGRACAGRPQWTDEWIACWAEAMLLRGHTPAASLFLREVAGGSAPRCRTSRI